MKLLSVKLLPVKLLSGILFFSLFLFQASVSLASDSAEVISFGVVPQQAAKKIRKLWLPLISRISKETGLNIQLKSASNIGEFQSKMLAGEFDVAYSNPLLYIIANSSAGYQAIAKEKNKKLQGIIVVKKGGQIHSLDDLEGEKMVFPENAFAATVLTQSYLNKLGIVHGTSFVFSHDAAYKFVSLGKYAAAGGVMRTLNSLDPVIKARLMVLKKFEGVTPHPFSVHPSLPNEVASKIQNSLVNLSSDEDGREILKMLRFNSLVSASDSNWDDVRKVMSSLDKK